MLPSVTVHLRAEDYKALTPDTRSVQLRYAAVAIAALGAIIGGGMATIVSLQFGRSWDTEVWLAGALAGALVFIWLGVRQFERGTATPKDDTGPMTLTVTEDGLTVENEDFVARHVWPSFKAVDETPAHVVIRTKQSGVFIVPKRDFASPTNIETFVNTLRTGIARAAKTAL